MEYTLQSPQSPQSSSGSMFKSSTVPMSDDSQLEIEFLKTYGIISDDDIGKLDFGRKLFLEQIENEDFSFEECLEQIKEESKLLDLCNAKINVGETVDPSDDGIKTEPNLELDNTENILTKMSNRINHLYFSMFNRYPVDVSTLTSYIKFFLNFEQYITINSNLLNDILSKVHSDPEVYIAASKILFEHTSDINEARRPIAVGLTYHSSYTNLHMSNFWFETQLLHDNDEETFPVALRMYKKILKRFGGDLEFHIKLLDCTTRFNDNGELQLHVMNDMVDLHGMNELVWLKLANTYLNGLIFNRRNAGYDESSMMQEEIFKNGLRSLGYNNLAWPMWLYMSSYINQNNDFKSVMKFYEYGINHPRPAISMRLQHKYLLWIKSIRGIPATRKLFIDMRNTKPTCLRLYLAMIHIEKSLKKPNSEWIIRWYFEACKIFGRENLKLWKDSIEFAYMCGRHTRARQIFKCSSSYLETELLDELKNEFELIKEEYAKLHLTIDPKSIDITDEDDSPLDHQKKNNCPPTLGDNYPSTSTHNYPSTSTHNYPSTSTDNCPPVSIGKHEFEQLTIKRDPSVFDNTDEDDTPPDHKPLDENYFSPDVNR